MKSFSLSKKDLFQKHGPLFDHPLSHVGLMTMNAHAILRNPPTNPVKTNFGRQAVKISENRITTPENDQTPKADLAQYLNAIITNSKPRSNSDTKIPIVLDHIKQPKEIPKVQRRTRISRTSSLSFIKQDKPPPVASILTVPAIKASILQVARQATLPSSETVAQFDKKMELRKPRCCSLSRMVLQHILLDEKQREKLQDGRVKAKAIRQFSKQLSHLRKGMAGFTTIKIRK